jgi:Na+-transporting NADH:ubiquinone oxidoreductase subunit C
VANRDTIGRTLGVALGVCLVCSLLVSAAAVSLRPRQAENKLLDKRKNILRAAGLLHPGTSIEAQFRQIQSRLVDLESGEYVQDMDVASYDQRRAARNPELSVAVPSNVDVASIKRRARRAAVHLVEQQGRVTKIILPVHGLGLWSTMYGFLALDADDLTTIRGLVFYEHGETPGLGGEIDNPRWQALWQGKKAYGPTGVVRIDVVKGQVDPTRPGSEYRVDGLSGATLTSRGVDFMLDYWLGDDGFGAYIERMKERGV